MYETLPPTNSHIHVHSYRPGVEEAGAQDHDRLAGALFELHLDGAELAMDDAHHALDLFGGDGPSARLLPQQVHHMGGEFITRLNMHSGVAHGSVSVHVNITTGAALLDSMCIFLWCTKAYDFLFLKHLNLQRSDLGEVQTQHVLSPVHTFPILCGRFDGSGTAWPGSLSVRPSYRTRRHQPQQQQQRLQRTRLLSLVRTRPQLAACCPIA